VFAGGYTHASCHENVHKVALTVGHTSSNVYANSNADAHPYSDPDPFKDADSNALAGVDEQPVRLTVAVRVCLHLCHALPVQLRIAERYALPIADRL
jgi:hypothetical protein